MSADRKADDEALAKTLRLRGPAAPVARVSRRALVVTGAVVSAGLFGAVGWSLVQRERAKPPSEDAVSMATPSERVTALPRGYTGPVGVPALGPPLPGDLGRPILNAQRQGKDAGWPGEPGRATTSLDSAPQATPSLARRPVEIGQDPPPLTPSQARGQTARDSGLFVGSGVGRQVEARPIAARPEPAPTGDPRTTSAERLQSPASPYILQAGAIIPAALITGLRSDTPGLAIAQVTQDVHDSLGGGVLLIPAGSRLIGDYDAQVRDGQSRLKVVWNRLILPSGRSIVLGHLPGADAQGMAGLQDGVDRHGRRVLAAAGLSTLLAIGAEAGGGDEDELVRALRRGGASTASQVGQQMVGKSLDLAPTLTIRPGASLRVLLTHDLVLEPYRGGRGQ